MGEIIGIAAAHELHKASELYQAQLDEAVETLEATAEALFTNAVNLAVNGPWRDWDKSQPVGAKMEFTLKALADTKDGRLTMLVNAIAQLRELAGALQQK